MACENINYRTHPDWEKVVLKLTGGLGVGLAAPRRRPGDRWVVVRAGRWIPEEQPEVLERRFRVRVGGAN